MFVRKKVNFYKLSQLTMTSGLLLAMSACSSFNALDQVIRDQISEDKVNEEQKSKAEDDIKNTIVDLHLEDEFQGFHSHKQVSDYTDKLAHDLVRNLRNKVLVSPVAITSFVNFDKKLTNTDPLGLLISESLFGQMQEYDISVMDLSLAGGINMNDKGVFAFSRNAEEIFSGQSINYILSGVMIKNERGVRVNARILELDTQRILATATTLIPSFVSGAL